MSAAIQAEDTPRPVKPAAAAGAAARAPELPCLTGSALALGTLALSLATFMNVLDTSIANVAIPSIAGDLGVSPDQGTWVITSFAVANAISMPLTGWLTRRIGQVRLFTASTLLFVLASFLCGLAPSIGMLVAFRALQGAVAGPMIPLSQSLLLASYPKAKAGAALAVWSMTTLVAPVVGPVLGGWITDNISWPWIFYINVPIGIAAAIATWAIYRRRETPTARLPIDKVGLGLLIIWVGAMQILLDKGKDLDWFNSSFIVTLAIIAIIGFVVFLVWELTDEHPIVDLSLFRGRNFSVSTVAMLVGYGLYFGTVVLLPLWLQQYMGYTATLAGVVLAPVGVLAILLTPLVGRFLSRTDPRWIVTISFLVFGLVMFMRSDFNTQADIRTLLVPTVIQGAALATFFVPLLTLGFSGLAAERIPAASGLMNFARITAGSFATSITTTLWDRRATLHHEQLVEHLTGSNAAMTQALGQLHAGGLTSQQGYELLNNLVTNQAYMLSANDIFYVSGALFVLLAGVVWLARPMKSGGAGREAAAGAH
ncbi:MAG TPA: DHA2 family efflux MFS transporter permease subunit [Steroidobacteraceae bacterium]|nr:DHA2 family efflux MFS transporter permease subunit [Steroidobacteraceae bacterium]